MLFAGEMGAPSCLLSPVGAQEMSDMGRGTVTSYEFRAGRAHGAWLSGTPPTPRPGMMGTTWPESVTEHGSLVRELHPSPARPYWSCWHRPRLLLAI